MTYTVGTRFYLNLGQKLGVPLIRGCDLYTSNHGSVLFIFSTNVLLNKSYCFIIVIE